MPGRDSVGQVSLDLVLNRNPFNKQMNNLQQTYKGQLNNLQSMTSSAMSKMAKTLGMGLSVAGLTAFAKKCIDLGSDLSEVQNVVDVTFGSMSDKVNEFAQNAATQFGLSETMAKQFVGTFGAMGKAFGFSQDSAYEMSTTLAGLAGDIASFYNLDQEDAFTKLKAVFTGETEGLKSLGVVMTQTALDQFAMANGFGKTTAQMSEQEKVALRYQFVLNQLSGASGDFARTSGGWANQMRILRLQFESFSAAIGQGLINVLTPALKMINNLMAGLVKLAQAFKGFTELITGKKSTEGSGMASIGDLAVDAGAGMEEASGAADNLSDSTAGIGDAAKKAAKEMRSLMDFDQIKKLGEENSVNDSGSSGSPSSPGRIGSGAGSGAGSVGAMDLGKLAQGENELGKFEKVLERLRNIISPTVAALKKLWKEGLARVGQFAWKGLQDFYEKFLVPIGTWTFGEGLPRFINAFNEGLMAIDWDKINEKLAKFWDALAPFAINIGEGLLWFWENVLVPFGTWAGNEVVPRFLDTLTIAVALFNVILEALQPLWQWFWDNVLSPVINFAADAFLNFWDWFNEKLQAFSKWCGENAEVVRTITTVILSFFAAWQILSLVEKIMTFVGTIQTLASTIGMLISGAFSPWLLIIGALIAIGVLLWQNWDTIKAKAEEIWGNIKTTLVGTWETLKNNATTAWNKIHNKVSGVIEKIKNVIDTVLSTIKGIWETAWNAISEFIGPIWEGIRETVSTTAGTIKDAIGGITDFLSNVFAGDWEAAWNNISSVFGTIWGGFVDLVRNPINSIIGFINNLISAVETMVNSIATALNSIQIDIPDWVPIYGGGQFGFNLPTWTLPQVPYLAQGGYVGPNTPRLAMIGDNRIEGEIVSPESKLEEMARAAAAGGNSEVIDLLRQILAYLMNIDPVALDPESIRKYFIKETNKNTKAGRPELVY